MKTIKSHRLSITSRVIEGPGERCTMALAGHLFVPLRSGRVLLTEQQLWKFIASTLKDEVFDEGYAKPRGELVVWGHCHPPGGRASASYVRVSLGPIEKKLAVIGDREWIGDNASDPVPFETMPIDHAHAFGGEGFERNPLGRGAKRLSKDGSTFSPLPNVEHVDRLIHTPSDRPEPALLRPIPMTWPQRRSIAGTYDTAWCKTQFPAMANDMDRTWFQSTQANQWLSGYFEGTEKFLIEHMHPERPRIEGVLPDFVLRWLVRKEGVPVFEVASNLETVSFFPAEERAVLTFRASLPVLEDDGAEVKTVLGAVETRGRSRDFEYYLQILEARERRELPAGMAAFEEPALLPLDPLDDASAFTAKEPMNEIVGLEFLAMINGDRGKARDAEKMKVDIQKQIAETRQEIRAESLLTEERKLKEIANLDIKEIEVVAMLDKLGTTSVYKAATDPEELDKLSKEQEKLAGGGPKSNSAADIRSYIDEQIAAEKQATRAELLAGFAPVLAALPPEQKVEVEAKIAVALQDLDRPRLAHPGLPDVPSRMFFLELEKAKTTLHDAGAPTDEVDEKLADPSLRAKFEKLDPMALESHRMGVHHYDPFPPRSEEESAAVRTLLTRLSSSGESRRGVDAMGADLHGLHAQRLRAPESYFDGANLERADLSGSTLGRTIFARAQMRGANLTRADLEGANLGGCDLQDADLSGATLKGVTLEDARLNGLQIKGCTLALSLAETAVEQLDAERADLSQSVFYQCTFRACSFRGAKLTRAAVIECTFENCNFEEADLGLLAGVGVAFRDCSFNLASMVHLSLVLESKLSRVSFVGARLDSACLRGVKIESCDFTGASMVGCDLSEADVAAAKLDGVDGRNLLAVRSNLSSATMTKANLMNAVLQKAKLYGVDLSGSNLFQADLSRVRGDEDLRLSGANVGRVRLLPKARRS